MGPVDEPHDRDEYDTPAEVDAVFRAQRRIALGYFAVFLVGVLLVPLATQVATWWPGARLTGWTQGFALAGAGLYVFFFVLGAGAASRANSVERRMLGTPGDDRPTGPDQ